MEQFTFEDPEGGLWWHGLDEAGRFVLEQTANPYGKPCIELTGIADRRGVPHIRVGPSRESVSPWARAGFLVISPLELWPGEFVRGSELLPLVRSQEVYVLGSAVRRVGRLCS